MKKYVTANYHSHTARCKHAWGTEREYIEAAIKAGIKIFGFSDHIPCPYEDGYVSRIRMGMEEAADYVQSIRALQEEYKDQIRIYVGFEAEYMPNLFEEQMKMYKETGCDYLIMGQHFLSNENMGPYTGSPTWDDDFLATYVNRIIEGAETGAFLYIAHPDIIHYKGSEEVYRREITRLCHRMKELKMPLEINLLGIHENKQYPAERFWKIAGEVGNDVILGIDAHWPENIGDMADYAKGMELVEKYGLHLLEELPL